MNLSDNFEELLTAFHQSGVDFMIVGGYAVIFHGYGRTTYDLDIWVNSSEENKKKMIAAFQSLDYDDEAMGCLKNIDFKQPFSFKVGEEPIVVDVLNSIAGLQYEEAIKKSISYSFSDALKIQFIHLRDLITNKMLTGRLLDKADVEELQRINKYSARN